MSNKEQMIFIITKRKRECLRVQDWDASKWAYSQRGDILYKPVYYTICKIAILQKNNPMILIVFPQLWIPRFTENKKRSK